MGVKNKFVYVYRFSNEYFNSYFDRIAIESHQKELKYIFTKPDDGYTSITLSIKKSKALLIFKALVVPNDGKLAETYGYCWRKN